DTDLRCAVTELRLETLRPFGELFFALGEAGKRGARRGELLARGREGDLALHERRLLPLDLLAPIRGAHFRVADLHVDARELLARVFECALRGGALGLRFLDLRLDFVDFGSELREALLVLHAFRFGVAKVFLRRHRRELALMCFVARALERSLRLTDLRTQA